MGALRALGFALVHEVGFGADLVARATRRLLDADPGGQLHRTTCPAIVTYVEQFQPGAGGQPAADRLADGGRRPAHCAQLHGADLKVVFIGPCIAKKGEAAATSGAGEIDAVLTFAELRELLARGGIDPRTVAPAGVRPAAGRPGRGLSAFAGAWSRPPAWTRT